MALTNLWYTFFSLFLNSIKSNDDDSSDGSDHDTKKKSKKTTVAKGDEGEQEKSGKQEPECKQQ
jgi:hypothetical protein